MKSLRKRVQKRATTLYRLIAMMNNAILLVCFVVRGKKPFTKGYDCYKWREIAGLLGKTDLSVENLPAGYNKNIDERIIEYPWLFSRLPEKAMGKLLDGGSALNYRTILDHPSIRNKKLFIATLAPERNAFWERGISYIYDDLRSIPLASGYFDWIVSLSTLEHVGLDNTRYYCDDPSKKESNLTDYQKVIKEFYRLLKPGGTLYLSVPFGAYKNHGWLQVFNSEMVDQMITSFDYDWVSKSFFRYSTRNGWKAVHEDECKNALYHDFHVDGVSNDKPAAAEAVVCIEIRKKP